MGKHSKARSTDDQGAAPARSLVGWVGDHRMDDLVDMARTARRANKPFGRRLLARAGAGTQETTLLPRGAWRSEAPRPRRSATNQPTSPIQLAGTAVTTPITVT